MDKLIQQINRRNAARKEWDRIEKAHTPTRTIAGIRVKDYPPSRSTKAPTPAGGQKDDKHVIGVMIKQLGLPTAYGVLVEAYKADSETVEFLGTRVKVASLGTAQKDATPGTAQSQAEMMVLEEARKRAKCPKNIFDVLIRALGHEQTYRFLQLAYVPLEETNDD